MYGDDEYLETQVMTASPHQLHLMVIDGAIRYADQAVKALEQDNIENAHLALNNSRGFVGELISGLDETSAPELVATLKGLFFFVFRNLIEADLNRDAQPVHDALKILRMHRETWIAMADISREEQNAGAPQNSPPQPHISPQQASDEQHGRSWTS